MKRRFELVGLCACAAFLGCATTDRPKGSAGEVCGAPGILGKIVADNDVAPEVAAKIPDVVPAVGGLEASAKLGIKSKAETSLQTIAAGNQQCYFVTALAMCAMSSAREARSDSERSAWIDLAKEFKVLLPSCPGEKTVESGGGKPPDPNLAVQDAERCEQLASNQYQGQVEFWVGDRGVVNESWALKLKNGRAERWSLERGGWTATDHVERGIWISTTIEGKRRAWAPASCTQPLYGVGLLWNSDGKASGPPQDCEMFGFQRVSDPQLCKVKIIPKYGQLVTSADGTIGSSSSGTVFTAKFPPP